MAGTRYGKINHDRIVNNIIRFPSAIARDAFKAEFETYHAEHDHDGAVPTFECITAKDVKNSIDGGRVHNREELTIDGYTWYEIKEYHTRKHPDSYTHYNMPSCCVSPLIVLGDNKDFIDSETLQRHQLSNIFGDIPDLDFENLVKSVEENGFMDPIIRTFEGRILDGWHRYKAALKLNIVRKLRFMEWSEEKEGKALAFVMARNIERRHLTAGQRAQIVVEANAWLERGNVKAQKDSGTPNGAPKSKAELAKAANVGTTSIDRAKIVSQTGRSDEVISGEKSATKVIKEETLKELREQVSAALTKYKQRYEYNEEDLIGRASLSMFIEAFRALEKSDQTGAATAEELKGLFGLLKRQSYPIAFHLRKLHGSDAECGYYDATRKPTPEADNPYTDTFIYDDKKITQSLIPSFLGQLSDDSDTHVRENALEKLQMIGEALVRRGYTVDSMLLNIHKKSESGEAEGNTPEAAEPEPIRKPDPEGCKQELRRILRLQGELNKGNINHKDLSATYHVSKDRVNEFADEVRRKAWENAVSQHSRYANDITNVWLDDKTVSESVDLDVFKGRIIEKFGLRENVFEKNFHDLTLREVWQENDTLQNIHWDLTLTESSLLKQILRGDIQDAPETENRVFTVEGLSVFFSTEVDGQPDPNFGEDLLYFGDDDSGEYDEELNKVPDEVIKAIEAFLKNYYR